MPVDIPSPPRGGRWKPRRYAMLGTVGGSEGRRRTVRSARLAALGKGPLRKAFWKKREFLYAIGAKISRSGRQICLFNTKYY
jgi:hypothetical protein